MNAQPQTLNVREESLEQTLDCYLPHVRYLRGAHVTHTEGFISFESELGSCVAMAEGDLGAFPDLLTETQMRSIT